MIAASMRSSERRAGGTVLEHMQHPIPRGQLTADLRERLRQDQRRQMIDHIARLGDLPVHLAMTHIEAWEETEEDWQPERHYLSPREYQPVVLTLTVRLRQVRWYSETPQEVR